MSCSRHCSIYKASDSQWYLELGNEEYAERDNSTTYGPFPSEQALKQELDRHSNPGGSWHDDSGTAAPPTKSGDGGPVVKPQPRRAAFGGYPRRW